MYDYMVAHYVAKIRYYADMFLQSPAGEKFRAEVISKRASNKKLPNLDIAALRGYKEREGIKWTSEQVYDIFSILAEVTSTDIHGALVYNEVYDANLTILILSG